MDEDNKKEGTVSPKRFRSTSAMEPGGLGTVECPYHKKPLQIQTEKAMVPVIGEDGKETGDMQEIEVQYAVCACTESGKPNKYRNRRVWQKT